MVASYLKLLICERDPVAIATGKQYRMIANSYFLVTMEAGKHAWLEVKQFLLGKTTEDGKFGCKLCTGARWGATSYGL